jgi:hypothetical protein
MTSEQKEVMPYHVMAFFDETSAPTEAVNARLRRRLTGRDHTLFVNFRLHTKGGHK